MTAAGKTVELARYRIPTGERALHAQRIDGRVAVMDVPVDHDDRVYLVERHVISSAELHGLAREYTRHSEACGIPAILATRALELVRRLAAAVRRGRERVAAQAMGQCEVGGAVDVRVADLGRAVQRGERACGMRADEVAAHAVKLQAGADRGDPQQLALADHHGADQRSGAHSRPLSRRDTHNPGTGPVCSRAGVAWPPSLSPEFPVTLG